MRYFITFLVSFLLVVGTAGALSIDATDYNYLSWGENIGWMNWGSTEGAVDVPSGDGELTGYVWGENVGWVSLNCTNTTSCGTVDFQATKTSNVIEGYVWGENTGWISLNCTNTASCGTVSYGVTYDPVTGEFEGYAWGENVGWVNMNCSNDVSCGTVDFKVMTGETPSPTPEGGSSGGYLPSPSVTPTPSSIVTATPPVTPPGVTPPPGSPPVTPPVGPPSVTPPGPPPPVVPPTTTPPPILEGLNDALDRVSSILFGRVCDGTAIGFLSCTVTALGTASLLMAFLAAILQNELLAIGFSLLQIMGLKRRAKMWGVVYDSKTKHPVPLAKVELLDSNGRVLETRFTDRDGRYGFLTSPTSLQQNEIVVTMRATKPGYTFPSSLMISGTDFVVYDHIYRGDTVHLRVDSLLNFNIPIDPTVGARTSWSGMGRGLIGTIGDRILHLGFLVGLIVVPLNYYLVPSTKNLVILLLFFGVNAVRLFALYRPYGMTVDALTGKPLPFALVTLNDASGTRVSFAVSDEFGRYILSGHHGVDYDIIAYTPANVQPQRSVKEPLRDVRRLGWVTKRLSI